MVKSFICIEEQINSKLRLFQRAGTSEDGTDNYFIDPETKERWILTSYESDELDYDIQVLMRDDITTNDLIEIALTAENLKAVAVASMTLRYNEEHNKSAFRYELIRKLEKIHIESLSKEEKERLKVIIYESNLYDSTNRNSIMNKHYTEIQKDALFYHEYASKAKKMLDLIKQ